MKKKTQIDITMKPLKCYLIHIGGHEININYLLKGFDLKDAIKRDLTWDGQFGWAKETNWSVNRIYSWIKHAEGGEYVNIFESNTLIKEIDVK